jgi:16S rRNA (adenine(1408)-N(1))-methyltransferase
VLDLGTGDGRFVSALAKRNPGKFYIGVDANVKPLEKPSMRATRKPNKGGLPNLMFVQAAAEDLPEEFDGVADEIHVHFPWGSLLRGVATGDAAVLRSLRKAAADGCMLELIIGIDPERDRAEVERLGLPELTPVVLHTYLIPRYREAGFEFVESRSLSQREWAELESSWARRLGHGKGRSVQMLIFKASRAESAATK